MKITSKNLGKNLKGCQQAVVFAATLGLQADVLVKRASRSGNVSQAVIFQAAQAAIIEEYCDCCQKEIQGLLERQKQYLRPRFSPGYGDFTIEHQRDLTRLLNTPKTIGLTLSDHFILIPTKSVTAIMGITKEQQSCPLKGCESCEKTDCQFRRGERRWNIRKLLGKRIIFYDGATGTFLQEHGLAAGEFPEYWNLTNPEVIIEMHQGFLEAGSDIILTNTFGVNRFKFHSEEFSVKNIVTAAVEMQKKQTKLWPRSVYLFRYRTNRKTTETYGRLSI